MTNKYRIKTSANFIGRFRGDRKGGVSISFALALIPMIAAVGAAVDFGRALIQAERLQGGVDNATLAAAAYHGDQASKKARADAILVAAVGYTPNTVLTINTDTSVSYSATTSMATMFFPFIVGSVGITRHATAVPYQAATAGTTTTTPGTTTIIPGITTPGTSYTEKTVNTATDRKVCLLVLDPTSKGAMGTVSNSTVSASTCEVHVKSAGTGAWATAPTQIQDDVRSASPAVWFESNSGQSFKKFCVEAASNKTYYKSSGTATSNNLTNNCSVATDPFAATLPAVTPDPCTVANTYNLSSPAFTPVGPGTYCGYPKFTGVIPAGLYVIKTPAGDSASKLTINGSGSGVTFYVADDKAMLAIGTGNMSAPASGLYEGILIFMPSNLSTKQLFSVSSVSSNNLSGLIYAPSWNIRFKSFSESRMHAITIVANQFYADSMSKWTWTPSARSMFIAADGTTKATYTTRTVTTPTTTTPDQIVTTAGTTTTTAGTPEVQARLTR